jgi:hypothetical protein
VSRSFTEPNTKALAAVAAQLVRVLAEAQAQLAKDPGRATVTGLNVSARSTAGL